MAEAYLRLGELLIKQSLITREQLDKAILAQQREGGRIGEILVRLGIVKEEEMLLALSRQLNIPYAEPGKMMLSPTPNQGLDQLIPKEFALRNLVLPLSKSMSALTCAMFDPLDVLLLDNLRKVSSCTINPVLASRTEIVRGIEKFYGKSDMLKNAVKESYGSGEFVQGDKQEEVFETLSMDQIMSRAEEATVVKLVDLIIRQAIDENASDIHLEPFRDRICLRYRIDGKLYEIPPPAKHLHIPIISRIKIISRLDISEKRLPQDGSFSVKIEDRDIDIRVSIIPTIYGEKGVLRILDKSSVVLEIDKLGFETRQLEVFRKAINSPFGLILLTGPTGSGKSSTLYAALSEIKDPGVNIVTVEDPVEYKMDGINQVHANPEIGLTFAAALRSFLRQDPDVMLVGEVRDLETAEICIRSALTGHLVLSTLHTNDAPSAVTRLIDIGIAPYLLSSSLLLVVAQRLVRKLCQHCKEAYEPKPEELRSIKLKAELLYRPKGCLECNYIGYRGRIAIAEFMAIDEEIRTLIVAGNASISALRDAARSKGMETLHEIGLKKVDAGLTSLAEVLSATLGE